MNTRLNTLHYNTFPPPHTHHILEQSRVSVNLYGQIMTNKRSRMEHNVADKLVYCHKALHLREKLQKG